MAIVRVMITNLSFARQLSTAIRCKPIQLTGLPGISPEQGQTVASSLSLTTFRRTAPAPGASLLGTGQSHRFYNRKKTIKIPPTKPLEFDYSGDMVTVLPDFDINGPTLEFDQLPELQNASEDVKRLFSLAFADGHEKIKKQVADIRKKVQEHPVDVKSLEVRIAVLTILLRNQMKHVKSFRKDKVSKVHLIKRIQARNRLLQTLRTEDIEKFHWLLEELKIKYIPPPARAFYNRKLSKRALRTKVARDAMLQDKRDKLKELRLRLEAERVAFEEEKERELSAIEKELVEFKITDITSLNSVLEQLGMHHLIEKPPPRIKRRTLILRKKFELHYARVKQEADQ